MDRKKISRALVSVYDKTGLVELGKRLEKAGIEILSTGSTAKVLSGAGVKVIAVEEYTGFPEMLGGRVKTLHPRIHGGILADQSNPDHLSQLAAQDIAPFDLIVINLYPFTETIASGAEFAECIEQIDIGGPSMLRGAAKNHNSVAVISDPSQYGFLATALDNGGFTLQERRELAMKTYRKTAEYDIAISEWLAGELNQSDWRAKVWKKISDLRYGENPHQAASVYLDSTNPAGISSAKQHHGKEMSFNNYTDADAALRAAYDHNEPCVAIIKHANPCGIAIAGDIATAHAAAHACDPVSAFGGVVAANRIVSTAMATALSEIFTEVVVAPGYEAGAIEILAKKPSIRILEIADYQIANEELRPISGGILIQQTDLINAVGDDSKNWQQVSGEKVSAEVLRDLQFAWRSVRAVKSNAILLAKNGASVGVGMGQVNRVDSAKLAVNRAGDRALGSVAASDAFFPFADGLQILLDAGVTAVVAPGGSVRDAEVIEAAKSASVSMFFTGVRHFSHA
ncbi:MAG: bifunctional phosphoribosylaminoimidazolecarboxamide formyltransferase/IMP cyclohydrolase [Candidatus Nanopelagicaceae bacterium]